MTVPSPATAPVLLAHPDPAARAFLVDNLTTDGVQLVVTATTEEAIRLLGAPDRPAAVLLGVGGPAPLDAAAIAGTAHALGVPVLALVDDGGSPPHGVIDGVDVPFSYPELRTRLLRLIEDGDELTELVAPRGPAALLVPADADRPISVVYPDGLAALQRLVDGRIQSIPFPGRDDVVPYMNEEGKTIGLPVNDRATRLLAGAIFPGDLVVGDVVLTGLGADGETVACPLTVEQVGVLLRPATPPTSTLHTRGFAA